MSNSEFCMPLTDIEIAAELAPAGLRFVERDRATVRLPVQAASLAPSCRHEDGRIDALPHEIVHADDPDMASKINAGWFRLAVESGLLTEDREFLLSVHYSDTVQEPELAWVRVQLLEPWDVAGSGVAALGTYAPEFTALSVDGQVLMRTTLWGDGTVSSLVVPSPATVSIIRDYAESMTRDPYYSQAVQQAARTWLAQG
ncbi:hypothetical protein KZZ52_17745 [Dactylosporangium sp. AC04546]|uniref:hypothetical protein n=1 Tax=Dactylosporangium sp. AC04546 TaxID=2862460 RepID=UPI001EDE633E|nr:hypothetical protein [Dactylosporangium sp. AC04546]WVK87143.1 hypothetical protein KZZ52_17745 [Dactylosporangium sp. AC04546]